LFKEKAEAGVVSIFVSKSSKTVFNKGMLDLDDVFSFISEGSGGGGGIHGQQGMRNFGLDY